MKKAETAFSKRLKELRHTAKLTQRELAEAVGISTVSIVNYENGTREPNAGALVALEKFFSVSGDYLMGCTEENGGETPTPPKGFWIPVLGYVRAGTPITAVEEILDYEEITPEMAHSGEMFALSVRGSSMEPRICEGDVVIVRQQPDIDSGDIAVVLVNGCDATIKRVQKHEAGLSLVPYNPSYETKFYTWAECESVPVSIVGKVVELRGKF